MKILFCNITYMNHYTGNIEEDIPKGGGAWVQTHMDAHEKWNFLNVDGNCYGFVMNEGEQFHIERLDGVSRQELLTQNVTVVWCAHKPGGNTVIVGWYEHATVYRYYQSSIPNPVGLDRDYFVQAKADDCYLLPEELRTYPIGRATTDGKGKGFGKNNFWYADSAYAKQHIVPDVVAYLHANRQHRINLCSQDFAAPPHIDQPLSEEEQAHAMDYYDSNEYMQFLPLGYRAYRHDPTGDNAYYLASALKSLHQYREAIAWYQKVIDIEGDSWEITSNLPYLLILCGRYEEAIEVAMRLLDFRQAKEADVKHEIYCILADSYFYCGRIEQAVAWLDRIIAQSEDPELVAYTENTRAQWLEWLAH